MSAMGSAKAGSEPANKMKRTSVWVPLTIATETQRRADQERCSVATVVLNAYLSQHAALVGRYSTSKNHKRILLGLQPEGEEPLYNRKEENVRLSLYLLRSANDELGERASTLGLPRNRYITEILCLHLGYSQSINA